MNTPSPEPISATLLRILIDLAFRQPDKTDRDAMLAILRKDGWI